MGVVDLGVDLGGEEWVYLCAHLLDATLEGLGVLRNGQRVHQTSLTRLCDVHTRPFGVLVARRVRVRELGLES